VGGSALLKAPSALTHVAVALEGPAAGGPDHAAALVTKHLLAPHGTPFLFAYSGSGAFGLAGAANPAGAGKLAAGSTEAAEAAAMARCVTTASTVGLRGTRGGPPIPLTTAPFAGRTGAAPAPS
jgi:hypothetical protein